MLPKGILFDLDDTIIAYSAIMEPLWRQICRRYADRSALFNADELYGAIRKTSSWYWSDPERHRAGRTDLHKTRRKIVNMAFGEMSVDNPFLADEIADCFSEERELHVAFFPGAENALEILIERDVSLALVTNGESSKQRKKIDRFGLEKFFKSILIEGEVGFGKPEKEVYLRALHELGLDPEDVWMVGDNLEWEVAAPQRLGIFSIWNDFNRKGLPDFSEITPDRIIHSISELVQPR